MATARASHGTVLKIGNGATPEVFTTIPLLGDVKYTPPKGGLIGVPAQDDATGFEQSIAGVVRKGGKVSASISYDPDNAIHQKLDTVAETTITTFQVIPRGATTGQGWQFPAMAHLDLDAPEGPDGKLTDALELEISGTVTRV